MKEPPETQRLKPRTGKLLPWSKLDLEPFSQKKLMKEKLCQGLQAVEYKPKHEILNLQAKHRQAHTPWRFNYFCPSSRFRASNLPLPSPSEAGLHVPFVMQRKASMWQHFQPSVATYRKQACCIKPSIAQGINGRPGGSGKPKNSLQV